MNGRSSALRCFPRICLQRFHHPLNVRLTLISSQGPVQDPAKKINRAGVSLQKIPMNKPMSTYVAQKRPKTPKTKLPNLSSSTSGVRKLALCLQPKVMLGTASKTRLQEKPLQEIQQGRHRALLCRLPLFLLVLEAPVHGNAAGCGIG